MAPKEFTVAWYINFRLTSTVIYDHKAHYNTCSVGKPSAGKSSFLNAISNAQAKIGNYPFTTIKPNTGVAYLHSKCPCSQYLEHSSGLQCRPRYGKCQSGTRWIPVKVLDVAGLIPGASKGLGLGNQFLDDLRHADVLIHVVDVSGTTDSSGKETQGYDPINDIDWLRGEIFEWIYCNLRKIWPSCVRKAVSTKMPLDKMFIRPFSGYGANPRLCSLLLSKLPSDLTSKSVDLWDTDADLKILVDEFLNVRFPTVIALNKIDLPDSDNNISKIFEKYKRDVDQGRIIPISALAENFLRKQELSKHILYKPGTDIIYTKNDVDDPYIRRDFTESQIDELKELDEKMQKRLDKVLDMIVFRYGSTGCQDVIKAAVEAARLVPFYSQNSDICPVLILFPFPVRCKSSNAR